MSGRNQRVPARSTDIPDHKYAVDDECTDSGYLSGVVSETITGDVNTNVSEHHAASLSHSLASVHLDSRPTQEPVLPISKDIPWQVLFSEDDDGDNQLHVAAYTGCADLINAIVGLCPARDLLDMQNGLQQTALHLAVMGGHHRVVRTLIQEGAKMECRDWLGETPLHTASTFGYKSCMQALLAPVPGNRPHVTAQALNQKNYNGQTSLHIAALGGYLELVKMLVFYGADINIREGLGGYTILHVAAERGDVGLTQYLLSSPSLALGETNYAGRTARQLAARTRAAPLFAHVPLADDEDYFPSDDDEYDEDSDEDMESVMDMFSKFKAGVEHSITVA